MTVIFFWLGLLAALANGTADVAETSSVTSDNPVPVTELYIGWDCWPDFDESCYIVIVDGKVVESGP